MGLTPTRVTYGTPRRTAWLTTIEAPPPRVGKSWPVTGTWFAVRQGKTDEVPQALLLRHPVEEVHSTFRGRSAIIRKVTVTYWHVYFPGAPPRFITTRESRADALTVCFWPENLREVHAQEAERRLKRKTPSKAAATPGEAP